MSEEITEKEPKKELEKLLPADKLERDRIVNSFLRAILNNRRGS